MTQEPGIAPDDIDLMLAAYADGELDAALVARLEAQLAAEPELAARLAVQRETAALLRAAFPLDRFAGPAPLLPAAMPARRRLMGQGRAFSGWAIAASLALAVIGYGVGSVWPFEALSERERMLTEVAEYHGVYSRETVHLVEVPAAQAEHLKAWLGRRVNRPLVIPDLSAEGLTFAGGRMIVLDGSPVAELMYTRVQGLPIAFCVFNRDGASPEVRLDRRGPTSLASWGDKSHTYVVVGEADQTMIRSIAARARTQL